MELNLRRQRADHFGARIGQDFADCGDTELGVSVRHRFGGRIAGRLRLELGPDLVGDPKPIEKALEIGRASARLHIGNRIGPEQRLLESLDRANVGLGGALENREAEGARAISARPATLTLPSLIKASINAGVRIATSNAAPLSISVLSSELAPKVITSFCSAAFSNSGASASSEVFTALDTSIRISAACAQPALTHARIEIPPATATTTVLMPPSVCPLARFCCGQGLRTNLCHGEARRRSRGYT
jgi:hypothetical protein